MILLLLACVSEPARSEDDVHPPIPPPEIVALIQGQAVLDHATVQPFLHTDVHGPLTVFAVPDLAPGAARLKAGGTPVRVVPTADGARFRFVSFERIGTAAQIRIGWEIPAEGASGHVDLELADHVWSVIGAEARER